MGGRRPVVVDRRYLQITQEVCTEEEWRKLVNEALTAAHDGDRYARQWISDELGTQRVAELAADESRAAGAGTGEPADISNATDEELAVIRRVLERGRQAAVAAVMAKADEKPAA